MITIARNTARAVHARRGRALLHTAAALLALSAFAAPASARPFQQYLNGSCSSGPICKINFGLVPAGQRMEIKNASCYVRLKYPTGGGSPAIYALQLLLLGQNSPNAVSAVTMVPSLPAYPGNEVVFSASETLSSFASPQQRFQAYVEVREAAFSQFACHISGDLVKL